MDRIDELLEKTSRTFALSIPLLPEPTCRELGIAYLLFRIADTFEDAAQWEQDERVRALEQLVELLQQPDLDSADRLGDRWARAVPIEHDGYLELLRDSGLVLREFLELSDSARGIVGAHTIRTARGMVGFVEQTIDGVLRLDGLQDLRRYCYVVAGIVGELSTELFLLDRPELGGVAGRLRRLAPRFGEALQLVNILKDSAFDTAEGRCYLPPHVDRAEVFALAREDLGLAADYCHVLQEAAAARGITAFCALPVRLAYAALDTVERAGPGAKIGRDRVWSIVAEMNAALDAGEPAVAHPSAASAAATS